MSSYRRRASFAAIAGSTTNTVIVSIQAVLLIPLYVHSIGPRLYGAWLGSGEIFVWMQALDLGLPNLMIQRIGAAHGRGDRKATGEWFATGTVVLGLLGFAVALVGGGISFAVPGAMGLSGDEAHQLQASFLVGAQAAGIGMLCNAFIALSRGVQATVFMNAVVLVSSLVGLVVSLVLVLSGFGLWAIAFGLLARAAVLLTGSVTFAMRVVSRELKGFVRVRGTILREFLGVSPATAAGGLSYAIMNQSETFLVATLIRPELALVYNLTRKAADVGRNVVDMIGFASYGGFAHLVGSDQRHRTLRVHAELTSLRLSMAIAVAAAYMAVNSSLVAVWVGEAQYGGQLLTALLGAQLVVGGGAYLMNYLYRATGRVMQGALALTAEAAVRVPLMIALLLGLGLLGLPLAGIAVAAVSGMVAHHWTVKVVRSFAEPPGATLARVWLVRMAILVVGLALCLFVRIPSWLFVLAVGGGIALLGGLALLYVDPVLTDVRRPLSSLARRLRLNLRTVRSHDGE